ncbi:MAG TPA: hypothetical protein DDY39_14420 [Nitrospira sp.]|nr:hypothetical protein [Nitrospira sp.]HBR50356.1 hypothetical protein [Nitrospira sp.]
MRYAVALLLLLALSAPSLAGEKGKLVSLLADYADFKHRVQDIRTTRQSGYASDSKELLELRKEILAALQDVDDYQTKLNARTRDDPANEVPLALTYAYSAMFHIVSMELDRNLYRSNLPLKLSEKYADIWGMVDPLIPAFSAP